MDISKDKAISNLDLATIKHKLMRGKPGPAWSRERTEAAEKEYRRFLLLMKMYPNELAAPSLDVDRFWHHHIIDTEKYARDCQAVFGYFLHRYPYLGVGGHEDASPRVEAGARMGQLYREVFGVQYDSGVQRTVTGFSLAVPPSTGTGAPAGGPASPAVEESDEPEPDDDLLDQVRFVVTENQRYDRMAEPVM